MQYEALLEVHLPDYPITIHLISRPLNVADLLDTYGISKKQISPFEKQITEYPVFLLL